ncbi:MAG TPA: 3-mercaptopyruvate sulfurtransferase [Rhodocyclaceae bacterium]|nr:3-mercaptopyruvate sulfurtransferase [Rhodocyclaceae bacterium]
MAASLPPLVTADWLAGQLGQPDLVVFDATYYMSAEAKDGEVEFLSEHIPGARFFNIDQVADTETDLPHMAPTAGRFARLVSEMGVSNDSRVIFYDQKGIFSAPRGWWLFRLFGHDRVAVLDGGLPAWLAAQRPVETGTASAFAPAVFHPRLRAGLLRGLGDMALNLQSGAEQVLDARSRDRFSGAAPEPRPGLSSGHMPGSLNVPFTELLNADKTMKSPEALRAVLAAAGFEPSRPAVCSCGSGLTATVVSLGLVAAGYGSGAIYDGSWTEWAAQPDASIAKG